MPKPTCRRNASSYSGGCRCKHCRKANTEYNLELRQAKAKARVLIDGHLTAPVAEDRHGLNSTYVNWMCRCLPCTDAAIEASRDRRRRAPYVRAKANDRSRRVMFGGRIIALVSADRHGKYSTYRHYRCRCEPCVNAYEAQRTQWAR